MQFPFAHDLKGRAHKVIGGSWGYISFKRHIHAIESHAIKKMIDTHRVRRHVLHRFDVHFEMA